jgi:hypothetical protein
MENPGNETSSITIAHRNKIVLLFRGTAQERAAARVAAAGLRVLFLEISLGSESSGSPASLRKSTPRFLEENAARQISTTAKSESLVRFCVRGLSN